jgi:prophage antirepressor-like protein
MQKANRIGNEIKNFNGQEVRTVWSEEDPKWYFSIVDVCRILTDLPDYNTA